MQQKEQLRTFCARAEKDKNVLFNAVSASLKKQGVVPVSEPEAASLGHGMAELRVPDLQRIAATYM